MSFLAAMLSLAGSSMMLGEVWLLNDGTRRTGDFVRIEPGVLIISRDGVETSIPAKQLSPQSIELAKSLNRTANPRSPTNLAMDFVGIPAGRFDMGIHKKRLDGSNRNLLVIQEDEPFRSATASKPFLIKATEVTWAEWNKVREFAGKFGYSDISPGQNGFRGDDTGSHPVTHVSWMDAVKWCNLFSEVEGRKPVYHSHPAEGRPGSVLRAGNDPNVRADWQADGYRLPTEAEWEHAWFTKGRAQGHVEPDGWHLTNSEGNTHPVRSRTSSSSKPLHDMLGNVAEWCWDWKGPVVPFSHSIDPRGPEKGIHRVIRGGSWAEHPMCARGGYRGDFSPVLPRSAFVGFRPVRTVFGKGS